MTAIAAPATSDGRAIITAAALLAAFMQAANISIPNAALLHIQGALSMTDDEVGWVFTAYIASGAIITPIAPWLAARYGRRRLFLVSIAIFALGLMLDAVATTPMEFAFARIVQGLASGPLPPLCVAIFLDIHRPEHHARMSLVGVVTLMLGISSGGSIGGWITEFYSWQWIFYVSLPLCGLIFLVMALWLPEKKAERSLPFDFFGLAAFSFCLIGLQTVLDRGERMDWFHSPEISVEAAASMLGGCVYLGHILSSKTHFLDKALFKDRNFVLCTIMYFAFGFVLLPTLALTSPLLDELLNYPPDTTGYMTFPRGGGLVIGLILMSRVPAWLDYRFSAAAGLAVVVYANWLMQGYSPAMDWRPIAFAGLTQGLGLGFLMTSLNKMAFSTLAPKLRPEGNTLFNLSRLYGSTIGVAVAQIFVFNNSQAMHLALAKDLTPYRAAAHAATASVALPRLAMLNEAISGQAAIVAIVGQFKVLMLAMLVVSPLILFLRKPSPANS